MTFTAVLKSVKAVKQRCYKVQDKRTVTVAFWFSMTGVGAVPTCCVALGWWDRQTLFYPGARCRWLDTTQWTNLGTAHARLQQAAGVAYWSTTQTALLAKTEPDGVVFYPKPPAEESWPVNSELCFLPFLVHFVLWFCYWFTRLTFDYVLNFGPRVCLFHKFLSRSSNKNVALQPPYRLFLRLC